MNEKKDKKQIQSYIHIPKNRRDTAIELYDKILETGYTNGFFIVDGDYKEILLSIYGKEDYCYDFIVEADNTVTFIVDTTEDTVLYLEDLSIQDAIKEYKHWLSL